MATRKRTKKQTLAEFRAWLSGVEELQPDDWAPTAEQWKLIRDKIGGIVEPKVLPPVPVHANQNFNVQPAQGNPYQMTSAQEARLPPPAPPPSGGVPPGPVVETSPPAAQQQAVTLRPAPEIDIAGAAKPNLDTSDGNYNSGFS